MKQINQEEAILREFSKYIGKWIFWENKKEKEFFGFLQVKAVKLRGQYKKATMWYHSIDCEGNGRDERNQIGRFSWHKSNFYILEDKEFGKLKIIKNLEKKNGNV